MSWKTWIKVCVKSASAPCELERVKHPLAPLTGQDTRAVEAILACWRLYYGSDDDGRRGALTAVRALLPAMQRQCWPIARELIAFCGEWTDRQRLWDQVAYETEEETDAVKRVLLQVADALDVRADERNTVEEIKSRCLGQARRFSRIAWSERAKREPSPAERVASHLNEASEAKP